MRPTSKVSINPGEAQISAVQLDSQKVSLIDVLPDSTHPCWLIPETEEPLLPVFDTNPADVARIIAKCPFFEYYVVSKNTIGSLSNQITISFSYVGLRN